MKNNKFLLQLDTKLILTKGTCGIVIGSRKVSLIALVLCGSKLTSTRCLKLNDLDDDVDTNRNQTFPFPFILFFTVKLFKN